MDQWKKNTEKFSSINFLIAIQEGNWFYSIDEEPFEACKQQKGTEIAFFIGRFLNQI